jgi:hypothetical protein
MSHQIIPFKVALLGATEWLETYSFTIRRTGSTFFKKAEKT